MDVPCLPPKCEQAFVCAKRRFVISIVKKVISTGCRRNSDGSLLRPSSVCSPAEPVWVYLENSKVQCFTTTTTTTMTTGTIATQVTVTEVTVVHIVDDTISVLAAASTILNR